MPKFNALYLIEHDPRDINSTDNRLIILYDDYEEAFFYYGTRRREYSETPNGINYINYNGLCKSWDTANLLELLKLLLGNLESFITSELHFIKIEDFEYDDLDFDGVRKKMDHFNCLYAYDKQKESTRSLKKKIDSLCMNVNV
jgi:hypothetical protein